MIVDIREDVAPLLEYVDRRIDEHLALVKKDPDTLPVKMIHFGFEFGQGNEVGLVFDTRPNAEPDGEWTLHFADVALHRPNWPIWHELPDDAVVQFIDLSGNTVDVMDDPDELICGIIGEAMKHVLLQARDTGLLERLPKTSPCELGVENMEGYYGWPFYEDRGKENLA